MDDEKTTRAELSEYRRHLVSAAQKSQEDYDKTILTLSGGALAISFAFLKDYLGGESIEKTCCLLLALISWGASVTVVLASFYFSNLALREAINQVDEGRIIDEIPGGRFSRATTMLNVFGGLLFIVGVVFMIYFTSTNLINKEAKNDRKARSAVCTSTVIPRHPVHWGNHHATSS